MFCLNFENFAFKMAILTNVLISEVKWCRSIDSKNLFFCVSVSYKHFTFVKNVMEMLWEKFLLILKLLFKKLYNVLAINQTVDYMTRGFMSFMQGVDITQAIGRVGLKVSLVLGPEIARATA